MTFSESLGGYTVFFTKSAKKDLEKLPVPARAAVEKRVSQLTQDVQNLDVLKLAGHSLPTYRLRVGNYRVIFEIRKREIIVLIVGVKHRRDAY